MRWRTVVYRPLVMVESEETWVENKNCSNGLPNWVLTLRLPSKLVAIMYRCCVRVGKCM